MKLKKERLESFKEELMTRRAALSIEIQKSTAEFINDEPFFPDAVDQAAADTDKTIQLKIQNRDRTILQQIDQALNRIDLGTFGLCQECGESITEGRMLVNPSTTLCIDCQAELESEQQRFSGRG